MGSHSKGKITQGFSSYKDKNGNVVVKNLQHRVHGSGKCKNIPDSYDETKMKVIPRSKRK
jgi:hypothetical protein